MFHHPKITNRIARYLRCLASWMCISVTNVSGCWPGVVVVLLNGAKASICSEAKSYGRGYKPKGARQNFAWILQRRTTTKLHLQHATNSPCQRMVHFCPLTPLSCFTGQFLCHEKFSTCHPNVLTDSHVCMRRRSEIRRPISRQLCGHHQLEPTQLYNEPCLFAHHILQASLCQRQGCNYEKHSNRHTIASNNFSPKPRRRLCSRKFSMYDICSKQPANDAQFRNLSWIKHCVVKTCNMNTWRHFPTYVRDFRSLRRNGNVVNFFRRVQTLQILESKSANM